MEEITVTLNPNDMGSGNTLSNGNLTVVNTASYSAIRATHGKSTGKWYWEVKFDSGNNIFLIGISNKSFPITNIITTDVNWKSLYIYNGNKYPEALAYGSVTAVGNILGVALDLDNGTLEFYKNGVSMGISHTNVKELGEVYPMFASGNSTISKTVTFNFGATPFAYSIPSGFKAYDLYPVHKILLSSNSKTYSLTPPIYATETAIPQMTSNTTQSGRAFASSIYSTSYDAWKAFDRIDNQGYVSANGSGGIGHLGYEFVNPMNIGKYAIKNHDSTGVGITAMPKDWTFEGSNDGANWTVLDSQINQIWTEIVDKAYFIKFNKINNYKMYRLNWTTNNGGSYTNINEFKMFSFISYPKIKNLPNKSEQTFINHGMESPINITQLDGIKSIESNSTAHESGKKFIHTVDLSKRRVDKIILS